VIYAGIYWFFGLFLTMILLASLVGLQLFVVYFLKMFLGEDCYQANGVGAINYGCDEWQCSPTAAALALATRGQATIKKFIRVSIIF
jgi:hypothetical protein